MSELVGVVIGGAIALIGSISATYYVWWLTNERRSKSIRVIAEAEVAGIRDRVNRYIDGISGPEEVMASSPMLTSIAPELGFLTAEQAVAFRLAITLDMEMRPHPTPDKAKLTFDACEQALKALAPILPPKPSQGVTPKS